MTPREQVERELAEELGFELVGDEILYPDGYKRSAFIGEMKLWSLCVRQRVRLNEVEKGT